MCRKKHAPTKFLCPNPRAYKYVTSNGERDLYISLFKKLEIEISQVLTRGRKKVRVHEMRRWNKTLK